MKLRNFLLGAIAMVVAFSACDQNTEDVISGNPSIELVGFEGDVMTFDADGGERQVSLVANRDWTIEEDADWIQVTPTSGEAADEEQTITIKVVKNEKDEDDPFAGFDREADIKFTVGAKSVYLTIKQEGPQGSTEALIVYYNDFDKEKAQKGENGWATYLDSFEGWNNATGTGVETVTYAYDRITARTNSSNGSAGSHSVYEGSGMNYLWFGSGKPYLFVKDITLPEGKVNFTISFGTERYLYEAEDNTFNWDEFEAYASIDGVKWTELSWEFAAGKLPNGDWDLAYATVKVPEGTEKISLYFAASLESGYAIDDLKVEESLVEGVAVDFTAGVELNPEEPEQGDESDATAIYSNNYDKVEATKTYGSSGSSYPYLDQFDGWMNAAGTGAANVTYDFKGMSARSNSTSNGSYSDYEGSGMNNMFFGANAYFATKNIALGGATNLTLTFGTEKYSQDNGSVFTNSEFHIWLSNDGGAKWVEFTDYTFAGGTKEGRWNVATANFTVPAGTETLSICMKVDVASSYRMDDFKLVAATTAGTAVDFSNATEQDFSSSNPSGGDSSDATAIYSNNYDKQEATKTYGSNGGSYPYLDQFDGWMNAAGTGAANVTYVYNGMSTRSNSTSDGSYSDYAGSGMNNLFFGKEAYFATNNIALNGATNLTLTFGTEKYSQTDGSVFKNSEFHIWLSNDGGAKWVEFTDYTFAGGTKEGRWNVATANFTVPAGTETLSICMKVDVASAYRMDDFQLVAAATAGTAVDFSNATEQDFSAAGGNTGEQPDATAIYSNNYDKSAAVKDGNYWPYFSDTEDCWQNAAGTGAANVTYASKNVTVRNNSNSDGSYSDYAGSGMNNLFFGKEYPYVSTNNITLGGATDLTLTLGIDKYSQTGDSQFRNSEFHIWMSNDGGEKWVEFTDYTFAGTAAGRWNVATANFTVPAGTESLSICFQVDVESVYRIDDFTLVAAATAGTAVDFSNAVVKDFSTEGGSTGGDDPVTPPSGGEGGAMTLAEVLAYNGALPSGTVVEGVVISNLDLNNLTSKKGMYIQDETAGLQFYLAANHEFAFGDKVQVDLSGVTKADYNGATQVSGLALDKITKISSGNAVQPKVVSMADFLANKYEGQYIALEGVQVAASDLSKKFVEGSAHTSINMEDASGNKFVIFSSKYATYGTTTVPQGSGTIKGISSISKGAMQLIFAQASDYADLTGARFDDAGNDEGGNEGGEVVTPPAGDVTGTSLTISRETMTGISWTTNSYGSQNISDLSTYLSWNINGAGFIGAKMCLPQSSNVFSEFAIQCQGNTDAAKQARFGNTTSVGKIKKITVISHNEKYTPNFNLALGTEQVVGVAVPSSMIAAESMTTTQDGTTYTTVYEPTEDVGFFAIYKNTTGALYFSEVIVEYEAAE